MSTRRSSRQRYHAFRDAYRQGSLRDSGDALEAPARAVGGRTPSPLALWRGDGRRRSHLESYGRWLWPHRYAVAGFFGLALVAAALQMVAPLFMRFIVDHVLVNRALSRASRLVHLHVAGGLFLAVIIFTNLIGAVKDYRQRLLNVQLTVSLRRALFHRLLHLPLRHLSQMKVGGILSRLTGDVEATAGLLQMALVSPSIAIVRLGMAVAILLLLNWRLALTAALVIPGALLTSLVTARRVRPVYRSLRGDAERIDGRAAETFSGIRIVRAFAREKRELIEYITGRHMVLRKEMFAKRRELALWVCWGLLEAGINVVIVWYGGYLYVGGRATIGDIMAFQWYTLLLLNPVWQLVNSFSELQRSLAATERVFDVLALERDKADRPGACSAPAVVRELRFEHVEFEYREGRPVVCDFDVCVPGGSVVALVGRSGAGKTTVTDLVARFHDPTRGRILLNGCDVRDFRLRSYRDLLAIVPQDVFLFDGSVRDNIAYGREHATDDEIQDAARRANAHEFIVRLPERYETFVGERGAKLSGGQQQRLAIARAILAEPQILILDEATSNLDTESEQLIQASLATLLAGRTTFVIAHRLSTIRRADLILVLDEGRIIERGCHDELMRRRGAYSRMVLRQAAYLTEDGERIPDTAWTVGGL